MRVALLAATALTLAALPARAQVAQTWNGSTSTDWFNGANWDSGVAPTDNTATPPNLDSVTIDTVTPNPTVMSGGSANLNGLNVGFTGTGSLTINAGAGFTITNNNAVIGGDMSAVLGSNPNTGSVVVDASAFTVTGTPVPTGTGMLVVGGSGTGTFTARNGATVNTVDSYVGFGPGSSGTATLTGGTSTWTNSGSNYVGNQGTGVFNVLNGATVSVGGDTVVGLNNTGNGTLNISGALSSWTTTGVTVLGGSVITPTIGGSGTINISDGGAYTSTNQMLIGLVGTGTVNITGGTLTTAAGFFVGYASGATGTVNINGSTAAWTDCGCAAVTIGGNDGTFAGGTGTVNVLNGGNVTLSSTLNLGRDNGTHTSNGTLNISGTNSTVTIGVGVADALVIGRNGTGAVNITDGGVLATDGISYLGYRRGATGTVTIDGTGSRWDVSGSGVVVGGNDGFSTGGDGTITVRNGGTFNSADVVLGFDSSKTSQGTITVTGTGSTWNAGSVFAGWQGTGTINILDRATFTSTGDVFVGFCACSTGILNVSGQSTMTIGGSLSVGDDGIGTMTVSGSGTSVTATGSLTVGNFGTGTLTIQNGATVSAGNGIIGSNAGASGTVNVSGTGSTLTLSGGLLVGLGGSGTGALNLSDGGNVNVASNVSNRDRISIGAGSVLTALNYSATAGVTTGFGLYSSTSGKIDASADTNTFLAGALVISGHNSVRTTYTLVHSGSINGTTFDSVTYTTALYNPVVTYTAGDVLLTVDAYQLAASLPSTATVNQRNVAQGMDNVVAGGTSLPAGLDYIFNLTGDALLNALTQASGEPGASIPQVGFAAMGQFVNAMMDGAGANGGQGGGATGFADEDANAYAPKRKLTRQQTEAYAAVTPRDRLAPTFASRWSVWATGYGGNATINGNTATGSHGTSTRVYGTAAGASYRLSPDTLFGFAMGAAGTNFSVDSALGGGRADVFQMGAYARHTMGAAYITGALAYAWQDVTTDRTVTVSGTDKLHAQLKANALSARFEGGWRYGLLPVAVTPYAALQSTSFFLPSYGETATSGSNQFALSYSAKTVTATRSELGARFDKSMPVNDALLTLRGRAAWAHDWNTDRSATATFQSLPGASFTVNGAQPAANAALLSAGADISWGNGWTVAATFDGEFSNTTRGYAGKGSLRYAW